MTTADETDLERVKRHVQEGEEHVARQREVMDRLPPSGEVTEMARTLLAEYKASLNQHRAHLTRLRATG